MFHLRRIILLAILLGLFLVQPVTAAPLAQTPPDFGPLTAVALDQQGNGWAVAASKTNFLSNFLLRIEDGKWSVAADGATRPDLFFPDLGIGHVVLTADGKEGWAEGTDINAQDPVLLHLQGGAWSRFPLDLPGNARLISDITINADSSDGWLTVHNPNHAAEYLLRLQKGQWKMVSMPEEMGLEGVAISPNGQFGWGTGYIDGEPRLFQLVNGVWTVIRGGYPPAADYLDGVGVDAQGNGWVMVASGAKQDDIVLVHLRQDGFLSTGIEVKLVAPTPKTGISFIRQTLSVDANGRGWAAVTFELGTKGTPDLQYNYETHLIRLNGEQATEVTPASVGAPDKIIVNSLATGYNGGHIWFAGSTEQRDGLLIELHEPWAHDQPAAAAPLPGTALCAAAVPYCLRGAFLNYWSQNGGLPRFGYPITPEISESYGGHTYRVQYTERARFEDHPENPPPYNVQLGLLGNTLVNPRRNEAPFQPAQQVKSFDVQWFPETMHNVAVPLLPFWQENGSLAVFGYPRSEAFEEQNAADGKTYLVQYFERNRIEYHPQQRGTPSEFQLGLLGVEQFSKTYGFTP